MGTGNYITIPVLISTKEIEAIRRYRKSLLSEDDSIEWAAEFSDAHTAAETVSLCALSMAVEKFDAANEPEGSNGPRAA